MMFCLVGMGQTITIHADSCPYSLTKDTIFPAVMIKWDNGMYWGDTLVDPHANLRHPGFMRSPYTLEIDPNNPWSGSDPLTPMEQLVAYWKDYKQECYNDSTADDIGIGWFHNLEKAELYLSQMKCMPCPYVAYYSDGGYRIGHIVHRQPTLEGFMDYLERKGE